MARSKLGNFEKALGIEIRQARNRACISQEQLADALGVSFQSVQNYESGMRRLNAKMLSEICRFLKIEPNDILGWDGLRTPPRISFPESLLGFGNVKGAELTMAEAFVLASFRHDIWNCSVGLKQNS